MTVYVVAEPNLDDPSDLLFASTDRAQAERLVEALARIHPDRGYYVEEVPLLAADQVAVRYGHKELRLDFWTPPAIVAEGP